VVAAERPYSAAEISAQFGLPVWAQVPWDPRAAEVLSDGEREPRRFFGGSVMGQLRAESKSLSERLIRARAASRLVTGGVR
ncbi:MAG: hypothetical protein Q4F67_16900, partial [Propionibacteriaceae bacterium]|nr:hypothetical protein [Propionibacteriaceae bacterium]